MARKKSSTKQSNTVRTKLRKKVTNKDELIVYLNAHPDSEYPFVEKVWNDSVRKCQENEGKQDRVTYKTVIDEDGFPHQQKVRTVPFVTDPCRMYFKMMSMKQNAAYGEKLRRERLEQINNERETFKIYLNKEDEHERIGNDILDWIEVFPADEREYLKKRYAAYFDTYDINDGADKVMLKRLLSLEIEAYRIDVARATNKAVDINDEKKVTELIESTLESMKWTKKQRSARDDMAKNRFTVWMDNLAKEGKFVVENKKYEKDDIDFLIDTILKSTSEMMS